VTDLATIAEAADALTNPIQVRERYEQWINRNRVVKHWTHTMPSLLDQLAGAVIPGEVYVEDQGGHIVRTPRSVPPARLEAVNALIQIEAGAALWVTRSSLKLRIDAPSNIRALVGAQVDSDAATGILNDLRRWYGWAATLTGWERPAWKPSVGCPACEAKTLRIHLARKTAACVTCGEAWTPDTIGVLAAHIEANSNRREYDTAHLRTAAVHSRRTEEVTRSSFEPRPDLPYVNQGAS
jgi:hypothetical protein